MIDDQRTDHMIRSWIDTGPDRASAEFVERTLAPIPRMRQRRSWRIGLERRVGPLMPLAAAVAVVAVVVGLGLLPKGVPIGGPNPSSSPSPALGSNKPTFELIFGEGATARRWAYAGTSHGGRLRAERISGPPLSAYIATSGTPSGSPHSGRRPAAPHPAADDAPFSVVRRRAGAERGLTARRH